MCSPSPREPLSWGLGLTDIRAKLTWPSQSHLPCGQAQAEGQATPTSPSSSSLSLLIAHHVAFGAPEILPTLVPLTSPASSGPSASQPLHSSHTEPSLFGHTPLLFLIPVL